MKKSGEESENQREPNRMQPSRQEDAEDDRLSQKGQGKAQDGMEPREKKKQ